MTGEPRKIKIIENPFVGEAYANKLIAASFDGGAVAVTLGVMWFLPEGNGDTLEKSNILPVHVTSRLALSPAGAVELANALTNMLKTLSQAQQKAAALPPTSAKSTKKDRSEPA